MTVMDGPLVDTPADVGPPGDSTADLRLAAAGLAALSALAAQEAVVFAAQVGRARRDPRQRQAHTGPERKVLRGGAWTSGTRTS